MVGKHVNPHQFRMFIPAHELMGFYAGDGNPDYDLTYGEEKPLLELKREQNEKPGGDGSEPLIKSVAREGVHTPVSISRKEILNGHHRVVAAYDVNPNMEIPVINER